MLEFSGCGGTAQHPLCTEPCQCVSGQPWGYRGALQGQMQPLHCAAGLLEPALSTAAGVSRWCVVGAGLLNAGVTQWRCSATTAYRALPVCERPVLGMPKAQQDQMQPLQCAAGVMEPALGAAAGLGRWCAGGAVLLNAGVFQLWRHHSATTARRALLVREWPALGMPWATSRSNEAS